MASCGRSGCEDGIVVIDVEKRISTHCECKAIERRRRRGAQLSRYVPRRYRNMSFDRYPLTDLQPHIKSKVNAYLAELGDNIDHGRGLWITGPSGVGKTALLAMIVSEAARLETTRIRKTPERVADEAREAHAARLIGKPPSAEEDVGVGAAFENVPDLLDRIRRTYGDDVAGGTQSDIHRQLAAVALLALDDVTAVRDTGWSAEQLYLIVNGRQGAERATVVSTSSDRPLDRTLEWRLHDMCGDPLELNTYRGLHAA